MLKKKKKNKKSLSTFVINHKYDSWRESFSSYLFQKLLTLSYSRIKSRFPTIINIPRIAHSEKFCEPVAKICYRVPLRSIYAIPAVCQFEKWHRPWLSFAEGEGVEGERKQKDREGAGKGEESADNNGFDAEGESRDERISRRPDYERDRATLHRAILKPCQHFMRHGIVHPLPPRFIPCGLFRSQRHPSNRF